MTARATVERARAEGMDLLSSMTEVLAGQVHCWSEECQRFLEWQRGSVLLAEATCGLRSQHETTLSRLLAAGRMLRAATSDPAFMDRRAADLVKARVAQLQESWELTHPTMSAEEAEAFLAASLGPVR